jgi:hypothetical protein
MVDMLNSTITNGMQMSSPSFKTIVPSQTDSKKQERLELLTYVKAHFDLIAVTLLVAYLGYQVYKISKEKGSK